MKRTRSVAQNLKATRVEALKMHRTRSQERYVTRVVRAFRPHEICDSARRRFLWPLN